MRILTNISKSELNHLTNQPTAKAMVEKVKNEGIYIPEGDVEGAKAFVEMRNSQKQKDSLQISNEGMAVLEKNNKPREDSSQEEQIKEKISELKKELAEIKSKSANSEKEKAIKDAKANALTQQITMLNMRLVQSQKNNSESDSI